MGIVDLPAQQIDNSTEPMHQLKSGLCPMIRLLIAIT
jgi:hypothetical protein